MPEPLRVLFVCTGNTCRSPMAEALLRKRASGDLPLEVNSAGVAAGPGGEASRETVEVLRERGVSLDGFRSRMVDEELLRGADHVFCMTASHLDMLTSLFPDHADRFHLVCDFVEVDGRVGADVPDPIGQGRGAYEEVASRLEAAMEGVVGYLKSQAGPSS